ncbi:unnamed protein product [Brassica napus]|uniref:(rape) hypothetical protein n=1 Tax=Brassica napus TaxID=3708 RepID=A0A816YAL7_BRANA|nr:unnamed protein product [Brassica napus]
MIRLSNISAMIITYESTRMVRSSKKAYFVELARSRFVQNRSTVVSSAVQNRHVCDNLPLMLQKTSTDDEISCCHLCSQLFTGFMYTNGLKTIDVRCGSFSEPFVHASHPHPLYYSQRYSVSCSECRWNGELTCDECDFTLCFHCGYLPKKVMRHRYDDHPLSLYCGEESVDGEYWCEACEKN